MSAFYEIIVHQESKDCSTVSVAAPFLLTILSFPRLGEVQLPVHCPQEE